MSLTGFVHTGVMVDDLTTVVDFLTALGLDCGEPMTVSGEWVERIIDLPDPRVEAVMVRIPDGADALELVKFHAPGAEGSTDPTVRAATLTRWPTTARCADEPAWPS